MNEEMKRESQRIAEDKLKLLREVAERRGAEHRASRPASENEARVAVARCLEIVRQTRDGFLSEEYAVGQPLASFSERFACDQVAAEIEREFALGTNEQCRLLGKPTPAEQYASTRQQGGGE